MPGSVLGVGQLVQLEVVDQHGEHPRVIKTPGKWLVWSPGRRLFYLAIPTPSRTHLNVPAAIARAHRTFHRAAPRGAVAVQVEDRPIGRTTSLGRVKSLIYRVPKKIKSPGKNQYIWHHAFGDTGHKGGNAYPVRVMPELLRDTKGHLFIKRRPGNIFTVDTWLRG